MSREAWGDPPYPKRECCPNCGSHFYMHGCTHCDEVKRRCAAEAELLRLRLALTAMWPVLERAVSGMVFTADRAGEVHASMNILRASLKTPNVEAKRALPVQELK